MDTFVYKMYDSSYSDGLYFAENVKNEHRLTITAILALKQTKSLMSLDVRYLYFPDTPPYIRL